MNGNDTRLMLTDFAASLLMALSIGVLTSVALASAVVLIAEQAETPDTVESGSPS